MKCLSLKRGRYMLHIWPPIVWMWGSLDKDWPVGLHLSWAWRMPRRWKFPHDGEGGTTRPVLVQGLVCGPIDLRRLGDYGDE